MSNFSPDSMFALVHTEKPRSSRRRWWLLVVFPRPSHVWITWKDSASSGYVLCLSTCMYMYVFMYVCVYIYICGFMVLFCWAVVCTLTVAGLACCSNCCAGLSQNNGSWCVWWNGLQKRFLTCTLNHTHTHIRCFIELAQAKLSKQHVKFCWEKLHSLRFDSIFLWAMRARTWSLKSLRSVYSRSDMQTHTDTDGLTCYSPCCRPAVSVLFWTPCCSLDQYTTLGDKTPDGADEPVWKNRKEERKWYQRREKSFLVVWDTKRRDEKRHGGIGGCEESLCWWIYYF